MTLDTKHSDVWTEPAFAPESPSQRPLPAVLLPGRPHLLRGDLNPQWESLAQAGRDAGDWLAQSGVERLLYFSTQWLSVLGHSIQARAHMRGLHLDEGWHDLVEIPYDIRVDQSLAMRMSTALTGAGFQTKLMDYEGFPIDTGTLVADRLINQGRWPVGIVSCSLYARFSETRRLAAALRPVLEGDAVRTGIVVVSGLSGHWLTTEISPEEDHLGGSEDDPWNRRLLGLLEAGQSDQIEELIPAFTKAAKGDMGLRGLAFLQGVGALRPGAPAEIRSYGCLYGTGAAVVRFPAG